MFHFFSLPADCAADLILNLGKSPYLAESVRFFIYDSLKIIFLLIIITHIMGLIKFLLPVEKIRSYLSEHRMFGMDYVLASLFGMVTPFCSCSSIPLFVGFLEAGIPLGVTFTFLITSPLLNEVALALFAGMFGIKITLLYISAGLAAGIAGGFVIGRLHMERYIADFVRSAKTGQTTLSLKKSRSLSLIIKSISAEAFSITAKIIPYVLAGIAAGSLIHGYVPDGFFRKYLVKAGPFGVPAAVILAVPLYSNASGIIPVLQSLVEKGVPLGTAMAFMMAAVGVSFPEALILKKVMKLPLLITFFSTVTAGIIFIGYIFNIVL